MRGLCHSPSRFFLLLRWQLANTRPRPGEWKKGPKLGSLRFVSRSELLQNDRGSSSLALICSNRTVTHWSVFGLGGRSCCVCDVFGHGSCVVFSRRRTTAWDDRAGWLMTRMTSKGLDVQLTRDARAATKLPYEWRLSSWAALHCAWPPCIFGKWQVTPASTSTASEK